MEIDTEQQQDREKPKMLRPIRVRTLHDALRLLTRVMMQLQKGQVSENQARTVAYVANSFAKMFEIGELEKRVQSLEERIGGPTKIT